MSTLTPAEHKIINDAWGELEAYAEQHGRMGEVGELRTILAAAKRELGRTVDARGLLLSMFVEALDDDKTRLADMWLWPGYTRDIKAYAWHTNERHGRDDVAWLSAASAATDARAARINAKRRASGLSESELYERTA